MEDSAERGLNFIDSRRVSSREMKKLSAIPIAPLPNSLDHRCRACHEAYGFGISGFLAAVAIKNIQSNSNIIDLFSRKLHMTSCPARTILALIHQPS